jgi:energy-coupling factor transporter transmembrane protein EcfT
MKTIQLVILFFLFLVILNNAYASGLDLGLVGITVFILYLYGPGIISAFFLIIGLIKKLKGGKVTVLFSFFTLFLSLQIFWNFYSSEFINRLGGNDSSNINVVTENKKHSNCSPDILGFSDNSSIAFFTAKWSSSDDKLLTTTTDLLNNYPTIALHVIDIDGNKDKT